MNIITLDIETIPAQNPDVLAKIVATANEAAEYEVAQLKPPGNLKKQETIDAWIAEEMPVKAAAIRAGAKATAEQQYRATSFDGRFGHIAVIGYAMNDEPVSTLYGNPLDPHDERSILKAFYGWVGQQAMAVRGVPITFVGHNVVDFDLRFMFQRSVMTGIQPHPCIPLDPKPWSETVYDTMTRWAGARGRVSMASLCEAFGMDGKGDIDGSKVWDYIQAGKIKEVAEYCAADVERTRAFYKRMTFAKGSYPVSEESFGLEEAA